MYPEAKLTLQGTSLAPGLAMGRAFVHRDILEEDLQASRISPAGIDEQCERIHAAADAVFVDLEETKRRVTDQTGPYQAEVFDAQRAILRDLLESIAFRQEMEAEGRGAEATVRSVFGRWVRHMESGDGQDFVQRADDVADLGRQLLRRLRGISVHPLENMPEGSILVATRLLPSDAVFFAGRATAAVVVEFGNRASHCALIIRQMGIPALCNVRRATEWITTGDRLVVDGFREVAVVDPPDALQHEVKARIADDRRRASAARKHCHEPAVTENGLHIPVMANIANRADVRVAVENGADGVGLYRLEGLFMMRRILPTEDELVEEISDTLAPLKDKPAIVRLLDLGSDKQVPYLDVEAGPAPCLDRRGVRLLLNKRKLLAVQVRALLRLAARRPLQIMVPMVTTGEDMQEIRRAVRREAEDMKVHGIPPLVAMIEVPAAALCVADILRFADAVSLGTNDLTQYTMAAGRQNPRVRGYYKDDHPAVLRLVRIAAAEARGAPWASAGNWRGSRMPYPSCSTPASGSSAWLPRWCRR